MRYLLNHEEIENPDDISLIFNNLEDFEISRRNFFWFIDLTEKDIMNFLETFENVTFESGLDPRVITIHNI